MKEVFELITIWEPEKVESIVGIDDDEYLSSYEKEDNVQFANSYLRFLKTMGESLGPIEIDDGDSLICFLDVCSDFYDHIGGPRYFMFSLHCSKEDLADNTPYFLDLQDPYGDDFAVVQMPIGAARTSEFHYARKEFVSLREMLIYLAYWSVRVPQFKYSAFIMEKLTDDEEFYDIEMFDLIANSFDLTLCPYLDFWRYYDGSEASFCVKRDMETHQITDVDVFSNDKLLLAKIVETILDNTPLVEVEETD